ncbi:MAG: AraC family transcriptional regulator [Bacteroidota bacterium]
MFTAEMIKQYTFKKNEGIEVVSMERLTKQSIDLISPPHRIDFYQIYHFKEGSSGHLEINFEKIPIKPGMLLFAPSNVICSFSEDSIYVGQIIIFSELFVEKHPERKSNIISSSLFRRYVSPSPVTVEDSLIPSLFTLVEEETEAANPRFSQVLQLNYLENIVLHAERSIKEEVVTAELNGQQKLISAFYALLNQHFSSQKTVQFYCEELGVNPTTLNKATVALAGISAKQAIQHKLLLEAKALLAYTALSVKEICYQLGVNEPSYFTLLFKKHLNMTPTDFRNSHTP